MKNASNQKKTTTIITGFLGAGKTTFLNELIKRTNNKRYAVIENEYGNERIEGELCLSGEEEVVELNNGCLCCTLSDSLYDILNRIYERHDDYDQLVIEATGLADPRGIAAPFLTNPSVRQHFSLRSVICLIDAELIEDQLCDTIEAIHQITFSDILLINKIDLVSPNYLEDIIVLLKKINPLGKIYTGTKGIFPALYDEINNEYPIDYETRLDQLQGQDASISSVPRAQDHNHTAVYTHSYTSDSPFNLQKLNHRLIGYLMFQSNELYRMKGAISVIDSNDKYLIQSVGKRLSLDVIKTPSKSTTSKIVTIGRASDGSGFEMLLSQCK